MRCPDVIVTVADQITILEPQTRQAAEWLNVHWQMGLDNARDQVQMESEKCLVIISQLKAAGFTVLA